MRAGWKKGLDKSLRGNGSTSNPFFGLKGGMNALLQAPPEFLIVGSVGCPVNNSRGACPKVGDRSDQWFD